MKKYLFLALGVAALTSCSSDEVVELNEGNEIKFSVVADNDSRAAAVWCNANYMPSFVLYADAADKAFINGETYTIDGTGPDYTTSATRYWPESGVLDFYAIYGADATWTAGQTPVADVEVAPDTESDYANISGQTDIVYAVKPEAKKTSDGKVTLNFRHALSQIEFQAKNANPDLKIVIKEVRVGNVFTKGTLTLPTETTDGNVTEHPEAGTLVSQSDDIWGSTQNTLGKYTASFTGVVVGSEATGLTLSNDKEKVANSMLLIPQTQTAWNGTEGSFLAVKCCIYNVVDTNGEAEEVEVLLYGDAAGDGEAEGRWAYVPVNMDWKAGYKYIYTFNYGTKTNAGFDDSAEGEVPSNVPVLVNLTVDVTVDDFQPGTVTPDPTDMNVTPVQP